MVAGDLGVTVTGAIAAVAAVNVVRYGAWSFPAICWHYLLLAAPCSVSFSLSFSLSIQLTCYDILASSQVSMGAEAGAITITLFSGFDGGGGGAYIIAASAAKLLLSLFALCNVFC